MPQNIYFHSPCFDGIVSAVLAWDFLQTNQGWTEVVLQPVNYDLRASWLTSSLEQPAAVVDFLFHPDARFWADHHGTTFLTEEARGQMEDRPSPFRIYRPDAASCAMLLWEHLHETLGYRNPRYEELVCWADKTDSAGYSSVEEAVWGDSPALQIHQGLFRSNARAHAIELVRLLRERSLDEVAALPEVRARYEAARSETAAGLARLEPTVTLDDRQIAMFDVVGEGAAINRYAPFHFLPEARYSIGIVRQKCEAKVTAMRNPWRDFPGVPLGELFEREGGGGHPRVASVLLRGERAVEATEVRDRLLAEIRQADAAQSTQSGAGANDHSF